MHKLAQKIAKRFTDSDKFNLVLSDRSHFGDAVHSLPKWTLIDEVPINECRTFGALGAIPSNETDDPLLVTARQIINESIASYEFSNLFNFYDTFKPETCGELLGLYSDNCSLNFKKPPQAFEYPWRGGCSNKLILKRKESARKENLTIKSNTQCYDWSQCGPVSDEKKNIEYARVLSILFSLKKRGYIYPSYPSEGIHATPLINADKIRFHIGPGHHRFAALAAKGWEKIPLVVGSKSRPPVQRHEVDMWPAVRLGACTKEEALAIFDRIFHGWSHPLLNKQ